MGQAFRLAWRQLRQERVRFLVAIVGVAFAVILVFMQFGFNDALFRSAVRVHERLVGDLVLINPKSPFLVGMKGFSRRRLYQARGFPGVASVVGVYTGLGSWRNPDTGKARDIFILGFNPATNALEMPDIEARLDELRIPDVVLFDRASRPEYGAVAGRVDSDGPQPIEVSGRRVQVTGLYQLGTSFGVDGSVVASDLNFLRLFPHRDKEMIDIGLIAVTGDVARVQRALQRALPADVLVLTREEYAEREMRYWADTTAIGFVFSFGAVMAFVVGAVIVYQILFTDIAAHLPEYATLRAMGYRTRFLALVVLCEALILAVLGYVPGISVVAWLYGFTEEATLLPMVLESTRAVQVFMMTIGMCGVAGIMALRKVRTADPAEVF